MCVFCAGTQAQPPNRKHSGVYRPGLLLWHNTMCCPRGPCRSGIWNISELEDTVFMYNSPRSLNMMLGWILGCYLELCYTNIHICFTNCIQVSHSNKSLKPTSNSARFLGLGGSLELLSLLNARLSFSWFLDVDGPTSSYIWSMTLVDLPYAWNGH